MANNPQQVALYSADWLFIGLDSDYGGPLPHNATYVLPTIRKGFIPFWDGKAWKQVEDHRGRTGYVDGEPHRITEPGPLPDGWSDEPPAPSLEEVRAARIAAVDTRTAELILAGFEYEIEGTAYRFGYDADDQGNFTKAALSATLAVMNADGDYRQAWRGWTGETPHTLSLTAPEFLALATYAGKDHQEQCLASGWAITERLRAAATLEELAAIADDR